MNRKVTIFLVALYFLLSIAPAAYAEEAPRIPIPKINIGLEEARTPKDVSLAVQVLLLLTILTLAPSIIIMLTSFTRVIIVLSFVKRALATQDLPPRQVEIGLALFLTFFIMAPVLKDVYANAVTPFMESRLTPQEALKIAEKPIRQFMFLQTRPKDISLFVSLSKMKRPANRDEIPTFILIPSFMISEMTKAFEMGILIFIPFLVVDMVVASVLLSMGMIMLPPVMISLPFKILLFIMVDGWHLLAEQIILSYR